jgi:CubicO group peptidase (beta-lactamase class C family)
MGYGEGGVLLALVALTGAVGGAQGADTPIETRIDTMIVRYMRQRHIPGLSLSVVRDGHMTYAKGYGEANIEWNAPSTPETVYLLASMTKQFTSLGVMMLVNEGRVRLDDTIGTYVTAPPAWKGITIRHLLTHTAGLKDRFEAAADGRLYLDYATSQMLDAASHTATDAPPGAKWQYSDQGYFLLGMVIENASGKTYEQFLRERIFTPLGMTSTSIHNWGAIVPQRADGYSLIGDRVVGSRRRYQFSIVSHYGVQSTVRDLARYDSALSANALVPAATLAQMWTPARLGDGTIAEFTGIGYGFGWFLERFNGHRIVQHGGSTGTCLFRLPDDGISVVILTNLEQAAGSDPCFIARGVATRYVPAAAIVDAPVVADRDTVLTKRLRGVVDALTRGAPDSADYTPAYFRTLVPTIRGQQAALQQMGPPSSFELVADDTLAARVLYYRVKYALAVVHWRFVLDPRGRISAMSAR